MPQNSGHFFKHGCYFFRQWQQLSKANPRCWHRGFTFSSSTMIFNGSDRKGPWLPMGQACPNYGLKPCSVPTLLTAGPAAALGLPDLPVWYFLTTKAEKTPRTGGCKYQRTSTLRDRKFQQSDCRLTRKGNLQGFGLKCR